MRTKASASLQYSRSAGRQRRLALDPVILVTVGGLLLAGLVMVSSAGIFGAIAYLPTFIQTALGASATASGIVSTPQSLGLLTTSIVGGQLLSRTGRFKVQVIIGATLIGCTTPRTPAQDDGGRRKAVRASG